MISKDLNLIKSIYIDGNVFNFYAFNWGIRYEINAIKNYIYYFNNMRDALNWAYEYNGNGYVCE